MTDNAAKNAGVSPKPALVPQSHGGALLAGGERGIKRVGSGRRPSAIRRAARKITADALPYLEAVIAGVAVEEVRTQDGQAYGLKTASVGDRVAAFRAVAQLGMSGKITTDDIRVRLTEQLRLIASRPSWTSEELIEALRPIWRA